VRNADAEVDVYSNQARSPRRKMFLRVLFIELVLYAVCNAQSRHFSHGSEIPEVIVQRLSPFLLSFKPGRATDDHPPYFIIM